MLAKLATNHIVMALSSVVSLSAVAGTCGSLAALFGKLAFDGSQSEQAASFLLLGISAQWIIRFVSILLFFAFNSLMWTQFSKALQRSASTSIPTVVSLIANSLSSVRHPPPAMLLLIAFHSAQGLLGVLFLAETYDTLWLAGAAIMCVGAALLVLDTDTQEQMPSSSNTKQE